MEARERQIDNFSVLSLLKTTEPAIRALVETPGAVSGEAEGPQDAGADACRIDGFLCPGHVAVITGSEAFRFLPEEYGLPGVVSGFEPEDLLASVYLLVKMLHLGRPKLVNEYSRLVRPKGIWRPGRLWSRCLRPPTACGGAWERLQEAGCCPEGIRGLGRSQAVRVCSGPQGGGSRLPLRGCDTGASRAGGLSAFLGKAAGRRIRRVPVWCPGRGPVRRRTGTENRGGLQQKAAARRCAMDSVITMDYGSGGTKTSELIERIFVPAFSNPALDALGDGAVLPGGERLVFSTDSFVVSPWKFPGGDIGKLAVCGNGERCVDGRGRAEVSEPFFYIGGGIFPWRRCGRLWLPQPRQRPAAAFGL